MKIRKVQSCKDWHAIKKLYNDAFPANEKKPFWMIRWKHRQGAADVWLIEQEGEFSGFAITMNGVDLVLLDYFAVSTEKRGGGIGSETLKALLKEYRDRRFFLEIESVEKPAENATESSNDQETESASQTERERRKRFYLANGMQELGVHVTLFGVDMELLGYNCNVEFDEYRGLYFDTYGNWAAKHVVKR